MSKTRKVPILAGGQNGQNGRNRWSRHNLLQLLRECRCEPTLLVCWIFGSARGPDSFGCGSLKVLR
jgi:hypothetical protein